MEVARWSRLDPFKPTSTQQMLKYLATMGYPIPRERKSKKPTTNEEGLAALSYKFPLDEVLPRSIRLRKIKKAIGYLYDTFLGRDGRMHPEFTFLPDTGRLSSRAPNFQNIPQGKHGEIDRELALAIRRTIVPSPGCVLVELDWKAIEALLVGYFADDQDYIKVCRLDPHAYLASWIVGKPADLTWDEERLAAYLGGIKKDFPEARVVAKKANHAGNYGQGPRNAAKDIGCTVAEAKTYQEMILKSAPKVAEWKKQTRLRAHQEGRLTNPFGYTRAFWNVFIKRGEESFLGPEAWEALAFLPQSTGAAMCRETILDLPETDFYWLMVPIHDSLLLECTQERVADTVEIVKKLMTKPWEELGGLTVEVDVKISARNWAEMKGVEDEA